MDTKHPLVPLTALSKTNPFILACFLDASSSMYRLQDETITGFNKFIYEQRSAPNAAPTVVHLTTFDTKAKIIHQATPLEEFLPLTPIDYSPSGGTALFDAVGAGVDALRAAYTGRRRGLVLVITDGEEADSLTYDYKRVRDTIADAAREGWDFVYLGSDPSKWKKGGDLGMNAAQYGTGAQGMRDAYGAVSRSVVVLRTKDVTSRGVKWTDGGGLEDVVVGSETGRRFKRE